MAYALLIDDDVALLESYRELASARDLELETASSWDDGLALFHVLDPDLVIADYNMPGSRMGLRLLAEIRRLRPSVRLVLLSGFVDDRDIGRIESLRLADRALTKSTSGTRDAVIEEIRRASQVDRNAPLDWPAAAAAHIAASAVSEADLDELDRMLLDRVGRS